MDLYDTILLQKPDFSELKKQGLFAVDMHYHTRHSDTYTRVSKIMHEAEKKGCGVAITDHNAIGGVKTALRLREEVLVIPGIETSSKEGPHILSYFRKLKDLEDFYEACVKENLEGDPFCRTGASIAEIIRWTKEFDGVLSAAHPFCPGMMGLHKAVQRGYVPSSVINRFDAIEAITGVNIRPMTKKSILWARELGTGITGGSDGHSLNELGNVATIAKARTTKAFLAAILEKENTVQGTETHLTARVPSYTMTAKKHLGYIRPFIASKARCVIEESVYYHTRAVNERIRELAAKSAILVNKKMNRIPGRVVNKGVRIVRSMRHEKEKKA